MTQHISLDHGNIAHEGFFDAIQEMLGAAAPNFRVIVKNSTTLEITAATDDFQRSIAIKGQYRWRTTSTTAALPGGLANGEHPVFVTASANDFTGPIEAPDVTVHSFGLEIKEAGKVPATAIYREVGKVTVTGGAITAFRQTVDSVSGAQIENGALSSESGSDITWTREAGGGLVAQYKAGSVAEGDVADGAITSRKAKLSAGVVAASGDFTPGTGSASFSDMPGAELKLTPPVASKLIVVAVFGVNYTSVNTGIFGTIRLDSTDQTPVVEANVALGRTTLTQTYELALTAAEHTIKMRVRKAINGDVVTFIGANTRFSWVLVAA